MSGLLKKIADVVTGEENSQSQFQLHRSDEQGSESAAPDTPAALESAPQDSYGTHSQVHNGEHEQGTSFEDVVSGHGAHVKDTHIEVPQGSHAALGHAGYEHYPDVEHAYQIFDQGEEVQDTRGSEPQGRYFKPYHDGYVGEQAGHGAYDQKSHIGYEQGCDVPYSREHAIHESHKQGGQGEYPQHSDERQFHADHEGHVGRTCGNH